MNADITRIPPYFYIHVLDKNKNISRLVVGPKTFIRQEHEEVTTGEKPC
jgi:major vault protein